MQVATASVDDPSVIAPSLLAAARRFLPLIVLLTGATTALGLLWGATRPTDDVATARVVLLDPNGAEVFVANEVPGDDERFVRTQARFLRSNVVLEDAAAVLEMPLDDLSDAVAVTTGVDDDLLIVAVSADDAVRAEERLGAVLQSYRVAREQVVDDELERARMAIEAEAVGSDDAVREQLEQRAAFLAVNAAVYGDGVDFVETVELTAGSPLKALVVNGVIGGLAGLAISLFLAWQLADQNPLVRSATDVRRIYGTPLLGRVPDLPPAALEPGADGSFESIALGIETRLMNLVDLGSGPVNRALLVVGDRPGVGVSTTVYNVAAAGAENGLRVKVIDASGHVGTDVPLDEVNTSFALETIRRSTRGEASVMRPDVAKGGTIHEMYRSGELDTLLADMREHYDFVLFDCPPLSVDATALRLAPLADAAVLVVRHRSRIADIEETVDLLGRVDLPILGYIHSFEPVSSGR